AAAPGGRRGAGRGAGRGAAGVRGGPGLVPPGPDARGVLAAGGAALCDTLERVGPAAPTLCEGWTTADLAAHLVVRERKPLAGPGIVLGGPFASYTASAMEKEKAKATTCSWRRCGAARRATGRRPLPRSTSTR